MYDDDRALLAVASLVGGAESAACARASCDAITPLATSSMTRAANITIAKKDSDYTGKKTI